MPIIKSAKKRVRVARKATIRNVKTKRSLKTAVKSFHASLTGSKKSDDTLRNAQSAIDTASKKGIMHKNKAARKKRQLAAAAKAAGIKPTATKAKKTTTAKKSTTVKKSPTKKTTAAKKTSAKK
jgi:small subunit ribosomal protein S20